MSRTDQPQPDSPPADTPRSPSPGTEPAASRQVSLLGGVFAGLRQAGRDVVSLTLGRLLDSDADAGTPEADPARPPTKSEPTQRVSVLHTLTEQLRGAADSYLAAKLDEIEARVDQKLDGIENRIDRKIVELHEQLAEMRDRELRHRLRLLKITLVFTVLVAILSLLYKWCERLWLS